MPKTTKKKAATNGKASCYVVGPIKLQNELMASYLKAQTGNECQAVADIGMVQRSDTENNERGNLLFLDCRGKSLPILLAELTPFINTSHANNRIVLFNVPSDMEFQKKFIERGIHGFFYDSDPLDKFTKGVQAVLDGQLWLSREVMTKCILEDSANGQSATTTGDLLTARQTEILAMIAVGSTNEEISDKLCISPHTVKTHLYKIFKKINVPNRIQAALWAAKNL